MKIDEKNEKWMTVCTNMKNTKKIVKNNFIGTAYNVSTSTIDNRYQVTTLLKLDVESDIKMVTYIACHCQCFMCYTASEKRWVLLT